VTSPIFAEAIERWHVMRRDFEDYREQQHAAASHDCNGQLLNRAGLAAGINTYSLFIGPRARAETYASDELVEWWSLHGRMTVADFEAQTHDQIGSAA
jgi:hypothetical protein